MEMEEWINRLIWLHAGTGGLALLSGMGAIIARKGGRFHRKSGMVFFVSMLVSAITAMVVAWLPGHEKPFFFFIGVFSCYFTLTGFRAIRYRRGTASLTFDYFVTLSMLLTGVLMIVYPLICCGVINIILTVFGAVGIYFSVRDLFNYRNRDKLREVWQQLHLGKMMGGYISATTAFAVVNEFLPGIYNWFVPGVIGGFYIFWWIRRVNALNASPPG